jgi:glycosyltransferase involved in cell wall biosynthesis
VMVSVVIPTYNGADKVSHLLKALERQSATDFEVVVVVDGSTDNTLNVLHAQKFNLKDLKIISQENKGRAAARNRGAVEAEGDVLIFFDDDVEPLENVVSMHKSHHESHPHSILVGHLYMDTRHQPKDDFYNYRYFIEKRWDEIIKSDKLHVVELDNYHFTSQNFSIPKKVFYEVGPFDERLTDSEDFDFCLRAFQKGISIYHNKEIFAWHRDFLSLEKYIKRQSEYKKARLQLLKLHPEYHAMSPESFAIGNKVPMLKKAVSRLFVYNLLWKRVVQSTAFLKLLPRKIRYRLYEVIVYSSVINRNN